MTAHGRQRELDIDPHTNGIGRVANMSDAVWAGMIPTSRLSPGSNGIYRMWTIREWTTKASRQAQSQGEMLAGALELMRR